MLSKSLLNTSFYATGLNNWFLIEKKEKKEKKEEEEKKKWGDWNNFYFD